MGGTVEDILQKAWEFLIKTSWWIVIQLGPKSKEMVSRNLLNFSRLDTARVKVECGDKRKRFVKIKNKKKNGHLKPINGAESSGGSTPKRFLSSVLSWSVLPCPVCVVCPVRLCCLIADTGGIVLWSLTEVSREMWLWKEKAVQCCFFKLWGEKKPSGCYVNLCEEEKTVEIHLVSFGWEVLLTLPHLANTKKCGSPHSGRCNCDFWFWLCFRRQKAFWGWWLAEEAAVTCVWIRQMLCFSCWFTGGEKDNCFNCAAFE